MLCAFVPLDSAHCVDTHERILPARSSFETCGQISTCPTSIVRIVISFKRGLKTELMAWCYCLFQPQNILLTEPFPKGSIKICDLGFACLTNTGEDIRDLIGTPDYVGEKLFFYVLRCVFFSFILVCIKEFVDR